MRALFDPFIERASSAQTKIPSALLDDTAQAVQSIGRPSEAESVLDGILDWLGEYELAPAQFVLAGRALELCRRKDGMLEAWQSLMHTFPKENVPLRLTLRWHRRLLRHSEGMALLQDHLPDRTSDEEQAKSYVLGLTELEYLDELEIFADAFLDAYPKAGNIRVAYIRALIGFGRLKTAHRVSLGDFRRHRKMGPGLARLYEGLDESVLLLDRHQLNTTDEALARLCQLGAQMSEANRKQTPNAPDEIGQIALCTGQLGAGGAERQLTRFSTYLQRRFDEKSKIGPVSLSARPTVIVRHATEETGKSFFLPSLLEQDVDVKILAEQKLPPDPAAALGLTGDMKALFEHLPRDIQSSTAQMTPYFRAHRTEVAYIWQDGAVLAFALAAILAGVPKIVLSFRGMPPNLRPELFRSPMTALYKVLATLPNVVWTANSSPAARAYEEWVGLPHGHIAQTNNMVPVPDVTPDKHSQTLFEDIQAQTVECDATVVGVFRFDHNKRPYTWLEIASMVLKKRPNTKFVLVGDGYLFRPCVEWVRDQGLTNRIFFTGNSRTVGFWLAQADALMHIPKLEGLPNVIIEAQLVGTPVLATPAGGTIDVIDDGRTGAILERADRIDIRDTAERLCSMLDERMPMQKMAIQARSEAMARFDPENVLLDTFALFRTQTANYSNNPVSRDSLSEDTMYPN